MPLEFEYINDTDAPRPPKKQSAETQEVLTMLNELPRGKVIRWKLAEGQSARGARIAIGRIASNNGSKVTTWSVPEEPGIIYVKKEK